MHCYNALTLSMIRSPLSVVIVIRVGAQGGGVLRSVWICAAEGSKGVAYMVWATLDSVEIYPLAPMLTHL